MYKTVPVGPNLSLIPFCVLAANANWEDINLSLHPSLLLQPVGISEIILGEKASNIVSGTHFCKILFSLSSHKCGIEKSVVSDYALKYSNNQL